MSDVSSSTQDEIRKYDNDDLESVRSKHTRRRRILDLFARISFGVLPAVLHRLASRRRHHNTPSHGEDHHFPSPHTTVSRAGIDAKIWKIYAQEATDYGKEIIANWDGDLDVLLIFICLQIFSIKQYLIYLRLVYFLQSSLAFILEVRKDLEEYSKTATDLLRVFVNQSLDITSAIPPVNTFEAKATTIYVHILWYFSLGSTLISAVGAMLGKQWVLQYASSLLGGDAQQLQARRHQSVLAATKRWRLPDVINFIPIFMHIALGQFLVGILIFLFCRRLGGIRRCCKVKPEESFELCSECAARFHNCSDGRGDVAWPAFHGSDTSLMSCLHRVYWQP